MAGQRLGRISNLLATYHREMREGDQTNEISIHATRGTHSQSNVDTYVVGLVAEFQFGLTSIDQMNAITPALDSIAYAGGLAKLYGLHLALEGII